MIRFQDVSKTYNSDTVAIDDVSFEIVQGEFASLVGKSGAGKTTLIKLFLAQEAPTKGQVFFQNQNVHEIPHEKLPNFRRKVGVVFQDYKLLPAKTAFENVSYVMEMMGAKEEEIQRDVKEVLKLVGLQNRASHFPAQLSGGESQRLAIARALIHRPHVIVADEPTGNLDPATTKEIVNLLLTINELGTTLLLATHNKEVVNHVGKRVITLDKGKLVRDDKKGKFLI